MPFPVLPDAVNLIVAFEKSSGKPRCFLLPIDEGAMIALEDVHYGEQLVKILYAALRPAELIAGRIKIRVRIMEGPGVTVDFISYLDHSVWPVFLFHCDEEGHRIGMAERKVKITDYKDAGVFHSFSLILRQGD